MSARSDREIDRILARERPGFTRVRRGSRTARPHAADAGTPDLPALRARVEALRLWDIDSAVDRHTRRVPADRTTRPRASTSAGPPAGSRTLSRHHIVRVGHAHWQEADPLPSRVLVVSRSHRRIIGEQG